MGRLKQAAKALNRALDWWHEFGERINQAINGWIRSWDGWQRAGFAAGLLLWLYVAAVVIGPDAIGRASLGRVLWSIAVLVGGGWALGSLVSWVLAGFRDAGRRG